jgi:ankyrin repeat protein
MSNKVSSINKLKKLISNQKNNNIINQSIQSIFNNNSIKDYDLYEILLLIFTHNKPNMFSYIVSRFKFNEKFENYEGMNLLMKLCSKHVPSIPNKEVSKYKNNLVQLINEKESLNNSKEYTYTKEKKITVFIDLLLKNNFNPNYISEINGSTATIILFDTNTILFEILFLPIITFNYENNSKYTVLMNACYYSNISIIDKVLEMMEKYRPKKSSESTVKSKINPIVLDYESSDGYTALMVASINSNKDIIKKLIDKGADINYMSKKTKETPLIIACKNGHIDNITTLLDYGANIDYKLNDTSTIDFCKNTKTRTNIIKHMEEHKYSSIIIRNSNLPSPPNISTIYLVKGMLDKAKQKRDEILANSEYNNNNKKNKALLREGRIKVLRYSKSSNTYSYVYILYSRENTIDMYLKWNHKHPSYTNISINNSSNGPKQFILKTKVSEDQQIMIVSKTEFDKRVALI